MSNRTFLVTGSMGCIGAWVLRHLVNDGATVVATDTSLDTRRPSLLLSPSELAGIRLEHLDVTDKSQVLSVVKNRGVTHIIHLAGLQVPFCRANPSLGAAVNVVGTCNIFEAARELRGQVEGLSYASSVAVFGSAFRYPKTPVADDAPRWPETLYGVYKVANEDAARVYWQDWQLPSVGLRPYVVYGVARDQGMTSDISKALLAAAGRRKYHIRFSGPVALQHAGDVARLFIDSSVCGFRGAAACNLRHDVLEVSDFVAMLAARAEAPITCEANTPLPYPADLDDSGLRAVVGTVPHTRLEKAIDETIAAFGELLAAGRVDIGQLDA